MTKSLRSDYLYYDAGYSQTPPRMYWGRLDRLDSIKHFMFESSVWPDRELGWAIFPDYFRKNHSLLPRPGSECEIALDEKSFEFKAIKVGVNLPAKITVTSRDEFEGEDYRIRAGTIVLYCPKFPRSLRSWLDSYFAVDRMLEEESKIVSVTGGGIIVFVEVLKVHEAYSVRPALHYYPNHVRDKSLLSP